MQDVYTEYNRTLSKFMEDFRSEPSCTAQYDNGSVFYLFGRIVSIRRIWDGTLIFKVECNTSPKSDTNQISVRVSPEDENYILGVGINNPTALEFPVHVKADPNEITPYVLSSIRSTSSLSQNFVESELNKIGSLNPLTHTIYSEIESAWYAGKPLVQNKYFSLHGEIVRFVEDQHMMWCRICIDDPNIVPEGYFDLHIKVLPYLRNKLFSVKMGVTHPMVVVTSSQKSDLFPFTLIYIEDSQSTTTDKPVSENTASVGNLSLD